MDKPPIVLILPTYVVEYASVDSSVSYVDTRTLNVGGEWLGPVPKLAICKNPETSKFHLSHCSDEWQDLCSVESGETVDEVRAIAEKHYVGIGDKWKPTGYSEDEAIMAIEKIKEDMRCSFCGQSAYDEGIKNLIEGPNARICDSCVREFAESLDRG
jgi:ClpX C4-type zinc finger